ATWSANVPVSTGLTGVSCPNSKTCFATDWALGRVFVTNDAGATWAVSFDLNSDPQRGSNGEFLAINCPSSSTCNAVGSLGLAATTTDGGGHWRTDNTPVASDIRDVSCPSTSSCFAATLSPA